MITSKIPKKKKYFKFSLCWLHDNILSVYKSYKIIPTGHLCQVVHEDLRHQQHPETVTEEENTKVVMSVTGNKPSKIVTNLNGRIKASTS